MVITPIIAYTNSFQLVDKIYGFSHSSHLVWQMIMSSRAKCFEMTLSMLTKIKLQRVGHFFQALAFNLKRKHLQSNLIRPARENSQSSSLHPTFQEFNSKPVPVEQQRLIYLEAVFAGGELKLLTRSISGFLFSEFTFADVQKILQCVLER